MTPSWTEYDPNNPPTDTSKHVLWEVEHANGETGAISWAKDSGHRVPLAIAKRWLYIEPYVKPEPELARCGCGGEADRLNVGGVRCLADGCFRFVRGNSRAESDHIWNAAQRNDKLAAEGYTDSQAQTITNACKQTGTIDRGSFADPTPHDIPDEIGAWTVSTLGASGKWIRNDRSPMYAAHYRKVKKCKWTEDEDGIWETKCNNLHEFLADGPVDNCFEYCPYCGGEIAERGEG